MANNTISLRSLLEKEKLNGINFLDWFRNLRIVLKQERKEYVIEEPVPDEPAANAPRADKDKFQKHMDDMVDVGCLMLATLDSELQKQHENMVAYDMIQNLKEIYEGKARQERYETSKALFQCKMTEGTPVGAHVIKMMGYVQTLEKLGFPLKNELATDLILQSLSGSFKPFVLNFNMNEINKSLPQLLGMLRTAESDMKKDGSKSILLVREAKEKGQKVAKSKGSGKSKDKGKNVLKPKGAISKDGKCFHCNKSGHWKRNCPVYLEEVKKAKAVGASVSALEKFKEFRNEVQNQHGKSIKALRSDRGGEYLSHEFDELLKECGIVSQLTPPGTPQCNGVSERRNRTLLDMKHDHSEESTRERHEPERYGFLVTTHGDVILVDHDEPKTYQEAVSSPDSEKWLEAMRSEMDSMSDNQVWTLVKPPEGIKPIGCKWVFKKKTDMDGNVQTYKGRLVAKGYRQIHGIDYDETFSHVAMFKSIQILLALAAFRDYEIWQMDVKTAFLHGKLEEDVYMTQPEGFVTPKNVGKVYKLQRSIYGLKQASRSWNLHFNDAIKEFGFIRNEDEPCVYKKFSRSIVSFLILYVDDILIIGNDIPTLQSVKAWLSSCFSMKDLGEAVYILGVKIYRDRSRRLLGLSQSTYIDKVLKRFNMETSKKGFLPMTHGISLSKEMCPSTSQERERMSQIPYVSAIGSIMYAMICTRPDLSYALSMTSHYQANPGEGHWVAVKNILK
ncbi:hypothetical protein V6N12_045652 [Hibiscus sabdariffa]|uniref:Polyprotein n=1 Tax=Hibiscus sabdariffa TaxID=183260 RepID=A0ABR2G443_9ROSI